MAPSNAQSNTAIKESRGGGCSKWWRNSTILDKIGLIDMISQGR